MNSANLAVDMENKRLSELEGSMQFLVSELTQLKAAPPLPPATAPPSVVFPLHSHSHSVSSASQDSFQPHLHQYEPSSFSAAPLNTRRPVMKQRDVPLRDTFPSQHSRETQRAARPPAQSYSTRHETQQAAQLHHVDNNSHLSSQNTTQLPDSLQYKQNNGVGVQAASHDSSAHHVPLQYPTLSSGAAQFLPHSSTRGPHEATATGSGPSLSETTAAIREHEHEHEHGGRYAQSRGQDQHTQAINTMRLALGDEVRESSDDAKGRDRELAGMVQDMEGKFRLVMKKLELKGLLGEFATNSSDDDYLNHVGGSGVPAGGVMSSNEATLLSAGSNSAMQMSQATSSLPLPPPSVPLVRGEGGRGPGGFFRPQLGGPPLSAPLDENPPSLPRGSTSSAFSAGTVNSLSVHTGPVLMRDKGITFFNAKRNVKSCEKPTPNIGDYLTLDDKNSLHPGESAEEKHAAPVSTMSRHSTLRSRHSSGKSSGKSSGSMTTSSACRCASSRQLLSAELEEEEEGREEEEEDEEEEYEELLRELEEKVLQRVTVEAQLKVLRFMKKAGSRATHKTR